VRDPVIAEQEQFLILGHGRELIIEAALPGGLVM
jgi:hypothetical protein